MRERDADDARWVDMVPVYAELLEQGSAGAQAWLAQPGEPIW